MALFDGVADTLTGISNTYQPTPQANNQANGNNWMNDPKQQNPFNAIIPVATALSGTRVAQQGNLDAARIAGDSAAQAAAINADAIKKAQEQVDYYTALARQYLVAGNQQAAELMQAYADQATQTVQSYNAQAKQNVIAGNEQAQQSVIAGNQKALEQLRSMEATAAPGTGYLRQVVAEPGTLTPAQQAELAKSRLSIANQLHSSSLAGSGRSAAALMKQAETDFVNNALEQNRARALTAAGVLSGQQFQAGTGVANTEALTGKQVGDIAASTGKQVADIDTNAGNTIAGLQSGAGKTVSGLAAGAGSGQAEVTSKGGSDIAKMTGDAGRVTSEAAQRAGVWNAQASLANAASSGKAIGDIGSVIASQTRLSRYGT